MQTFVCEIWTEMPFVLQMMKICKKVMDRSNFAKEVASKSLKRVRCQRIQKIAYLKAVMV